MEGDKVRIVDDGSGDGYEQWDPARSRWVAAATGLGIGVAITLLIVNLPSAGGPQVEPLDALPLATTSTTLTESPPTTTPPFTTTASATAQLDRPSGRDICAEPGSCPSFNAALPGDDGVGPLPLGSRIDISNEDRLDFLWGNCRSVCDLDAHFVDPDNPVLGSGRWTSGRPFHVRHGFVNEAIEPLGEGFNVALYISRDEAFHEDDPLEVIGADEAGFEPGVVYGYTPDYVLRAGSDRCGPTFDSRTGSQTCEWFVYDFPDGLPAGRFTLWAVWEAPCSAWFELGFVSSTLEDARSEDVVETCEHPAQVISKFSSEVNSPFGSDLPVYEDWRR